MPNNNYRRPIQEAFEKFERQAIRPSAGPEQRKELRTAFFFGAHMLLEAMWNTNGTPQQGTVVAHLIAEMDEFKHEILSKAGGKDVAK